MESRRTADDRVLQRPVLYWGEGNDSQKAAWARAIEGFPDERAAPERALVASPAPMGRVLAGPCAMGST